MSSKWCNTCSSEKDLPEFPNDASKKDGKATQCRVCKREANRRYRNTPEGREKNRARASKWHAENRDKNLASMREKYCPTKAREQKLQQAYGISLLTYEYWLAEQENRCAICGDEADITVNAPLVVDHDHSTGRLRDLLCTLCNVGLGAFRDNEEHLAQAIKYLVWHRDRKHTDVNIRSEGPATRPSHGPPPRRQAQPRQG